MAANALPPLLATVTPAITRLSRNIGLFAASLFQMPVLS